MENATKAMLIVAGVLIGVMILSLGATLFFELENYVQISNEKIEANIQNAFNTQFTNYNDRSDLTIQDVVTAANLAYENNVDYNIDYSTVTTADPTRLFVAVYLNGNRIDDDITSNAASYLEQYLGTTIICDADGVVFSEKTGRVYEVYFHI